MKVLLKRWHKSLSGSQSHLWAQHKLNVLLRLTCYGMLESSQKPA